MAFSRPTLTEIITRIKSDIVSRISGAGTLLRRSILSVFSYAIGGAVHLLYGNISYNKNQLFILTAEIDALEDHGTEYGVVRNKAEPATGTALATGTDGTSIPIYSELQSSAGEVYLTDAAVTISGGIATLALTAKVAGEAGNDDAGITLSFSSPIPGVDTDVTVNSPGLDGGSDIEDIESFRLKILARKRNPPHGGIQIDYENWMKECSGVTRAWCIPLYQGLGTIGCAFVRDNDDDLIPSSAEIATVESYIISHTDSVTGKTVGIPVTAQPGLYMIQLQKKTVNFEVALYPNNAETQAAVRSQLEDLIFSDGSPDGSLKVSRIRAAISAAVGEEYHNLVSPSADVSSSSQEIPVMGDITFSNYSG